MSNPEIAMRGWGEWNCHQTSLYANYKANEKPTTGWAAYWVDISRRQPVVYDEVSLESLNGNYVIIPQIPVQLGDGWAHASLPDVDGAREWMRIMQRAFNIDDQLPKIREHFGE
jgi:hypothetical protein